MTATALPGQTLARVAWAQLDGVARYRWLSELRPPEPASAVAGILDAVRRGGDAELLRLVERYDGAALEDLWVTDDELDAAERVVPADLVRALEDAASAIEKFHAAQLHGLRTTEAVETWPGVTAWRRFVPLNRVGGYIPGGRAALASSVLMIGVPARLAGVDEVILATPPRSDGAVAPSVLAAARVVGVRRVLKAGGAHAIAALAYGTESVPGVDRILGAGGAWVTAAKRAVSAEVAIDLPAGPSECVVVADEGADPRWVAADLLAQAEHGQDSVAVLLTDSPRLADSVERALAPAARGLATGETALATLRRYGRAVIVERLTDAPQVVDAIAPEHLSLQCAEAADLAGRIRCAGAIFIGPSTPVAAGDYAIGSNHILPTGGAARAWSGVGVESFGRWMTVQQVTLAGLRALQPTVTALAGAEGLAAHGASVEVRLSVPGGGEQA